jgi:prolycopene isomerase
MIYPRTELPAAALRECSARQRGAAGFVVYLGLDATLEDLGIEGYSILLYDNMDTEAAYQSFARLDTPRAQAVLCLNNALPDCSPPGTAILSSTALYSPEAWQDIQPTEYTAAKNRIAEGVIRRLEEVLDAPISEHIEEYEVATPQTFARYTGVRGGSIYGYEQVPWDSVMPRMMSLKDDRHFEGLEFAGAHSLRCHGYLSSFMAGQTAALMTYRDMLESGEIAR